MFTETASKDNDLFKSTDLGKSWKRIHEHVYSFGVQGKFIFVSVFLSAESKVSVKPLNKSIFLVSFC